MVWLTGDQNIPSELLDQYRATLTEKQPDGVSRKRYPFRMPQMQKTGANVSAKQQTQRTRFLQVKAKFKTLSNADKQRWYAARPPWSSFLWYYNYFIMSGLMDVLGGNPEGASVIKSINHYTFSIPSGAPASITVAISTIDPVKAMGFLYGAGHRYDEAGDPAYAWAWSIYPYIVGIYTTQVVVKASGINDDGFAGSVSVIEYI